MLKHTVSETKALSTIDLVNTIGDIDYVKNGQIYKNSNVKSVLVNNESDLTLLTNYTPGTIAFTAGYLKMWQKSITGSWVQII